MQRKTEEEYQGRKNDMGHIEHKKKNVRHKPKYINNNVKCQQIKQSNQKANQIVQSKEIVRLNNILKNKNGKYNVLHILESIFWIQRYKQSGHKRMEKNIPGQRTTIKELRDYSNAGQNRL